MRTLIYKRTHCGDPDPAKGEFGNNDCMGTIRNWAFDAVIGIGGIGREAESYGIARRLNWIGVGPHKTISNNHPRVTFDHFLYYGEQGPLLEEIAPVLARRMYGRNVRVRVHPLTNEERLEQEKILALASGAPPSGSRVAAPLSRGNFRSTSCATRCPSNRVRRKY